MAHTIMRNIQNRVEFSLFIGTIRFLSLFPYHRIRSLCVALAIGIGYHLGLRKKVAYDNMKMVFPAKTEVELQSLLKSMYRQMGLTISEIYFAPESYFLEHFCSDNLEAVKDALSLGRGIILTTGHLGNWELASWYFPYHNLPMTVVVKRQRNPYFDEYTLKTRLKDGMEVIYRDEAGKNLIQALRRNRVLALLIDQNAGKDGILTNFLGHPCSTYKGAAKIALHGNIPVVPGVVIRDENDRLQFTFDTMIDPSAYANDEEGLKQLTDEINDRLERRIREHPDQWFWVHKRWKGAKDLM